MNWNLKNIVERALSTAIFTFVGSFGGSEVVGGVPNSTQLRVALWATAMATLLSIAKNTTAEGVVVESTKRAAKAGGDVQGNDVRGNRLTNSGTGITIADPARAKPSPAPVQKTMRTRTKPVPPPKAGK